ncbi:MAG: hypothetical protein IIW54_10720, partial [Lachnospiraceae bacterium]|nr:hypothetical protein [Lachnospiraceae bacterium]
LPFVFVSVEVSDLVLSVSVPDEVSELVAFVAVSVCVFDELFSSVAEVADTATLEQNTRQIMNAMDKRTCCK